MGNICIDRPINIQQQFQSENDKSKYTTDQAKSLNAYHTKYKLANMALKENDPTAKQQQLLFKAKEENDIQFLLNQMNDETQLLQSMNIEHQWAQNPQSLGSVATMYLGLIFMNNDQQQQLDQDLSFDKDFYENITQNNVQIFLEDCNIQKIIINLKKNQPDLVQMTVLLIVFLVEQHQMKMAFLKNDLFDIIIKNIYRDEQKQNNLCFRIACGFILRELYKKQQKFIDKFLNDNLAIEAIIDFMTSNNQQSIIEGLNMIDDLIQDGSSKAKINANNCKKLYKLGFFIQLQNLSIKLQTSSYLDDEEHNYDQEYRQVTIVIIKQIMNKIIQNSQN